MDEKELQQLIEYTMKKNNMSKIGNNEEALYASVFKALNQLEEPKIPFHFSEKVTRKVIEDKAIQERFETKLKILGLVIASFIIAGVIFKLFHVNIDFLTALPLSYFIYGLGILIAIVLIEVGDFYLLKKN
jgi:hypothetical protein